MSKIIKLQNKYVDQQHAVEDNFLSFDSNGNQISKKFETNFYPVLHVNSSEYSDVSIQKLYSTGYNIRSSYIDDKIFKPTDFDGIVVTAKMIQCVFDGLISDATGHYSVAVSNKGTSITNGENCLEFTSSIQQSKFLSTGIMERPQNFNPKHYIENNHFILMTATIKSPVEGRVYFGRQGDTSTEPPVAIVDLNYNEIKEADKDKWVKYSSIWKINTGETFRNSILFGNTEGKGILTPEGTNIKVKEFMCFDLTYMFGSGNEPKTPDDFYKIFSKNKFYDYTINDYTGLLAVEGTDGDNEFIIPQLGDWQVTAENKNPATGEVESVTTKQISINTINYYSIDVYPFDCEIVVKAPPGMVVICQNSEKTYYSDSYDESKKGYSIHVYDTGNWEIIVKSSIETVSTNVEVSNEDNQSTKTLNIIIHINPDPILENNSWETISWASYKGIAQLYWKCGDTKSVSIDSGPYAGIYTAIIIGINHNSVYEGNKIHFQLIKGTDVNHPQCISTESINTDDWNYFDWVILSGMGQPNRFQWDNTSLYRLRLNTKDNNNTYLLPEDLWSAIVPVDKYSYPGMDSYYEPTYSKSLNKLFILSAKEMGFNSSYDGMQQTYDYYKNKNNKNFYDSNNNPIQYWLRDGFLDKIQSGWFEGLYDTYYIFYDPSSSSLNGSQIGPTGTIYSGPEYIEKPISICFCV